jgi:hypothetical protein
MKNILCGIFEMRETSATSLNTKRSLGLFDQALDRPPWWQGCGKIYFK